MLASRYAADHAKNSRRRRAWKRDRREAERARRGLAHWTDETADPLTFTDPTATGPWGIDAIPQTGLTQTQK